MQKVLQPPTLTPYSIGFKRSQSKNKHSKWMPYCKEHYCQKNTYININEKQYPHPLHPSIDKPPPLYGLTPPISPRKSWYPSPLNDFLKNSNPTINRWGGVGRGGGTLWSIFTNFIFVTWKGVGFFPIMQRFMKLNIVQDGSCFLAYILWFLLIYHMTYKLPCLFAV